MTRELRCHLQDWRRQRREGGFTRSPVSFCSNRVRLLFESRTHCTAKNSRKRKRVRSCVEAHFTAWRSNRTRLHLRDRRRRNRRTAHSPETARSSEHADDDSLELFKEHRSSATLMQHTCERDPDDALCPNIQNKDSIPSNQWSPNFTCRQLEHEKTLSDCNLQEERTPHLVLNL